MRSRLLSLIYPSARILLAFRVAMLLFAPALTAHAAGGEWLGFADSPVGSQPVTALTADRSGSLWAGTEERGLARWDGATWTVYTITDGLPDMRIVALFEDGRERLWVATGNGLGYFPADRGAFRRISAGGIPALPVTSFAEDAQGRVWLATPRGLVAWQEDGALEIPDTLMGQRIVSLANADGVVWAATGEVLWRGSVEGWAPAEPRSPSGITRLAVAEGGALHALADGKVWRLEGGDWIALAAPFDRGVNAFHVHGERLWAARAGEAHATEAGITRSYAASLPAAAVSHIVVGTDGIVWLGTRSGLAAYRPSFTPPVINAISINGAAAGASAITLARNRIETLDIDAADGATVFAQLDAVDSTPRILDVDATGAYAGERLAAGEHTLRVWVMDSDFNRSEERLITLNALDLAFLPFGLAVPADVVAPLLAAFSFTAIAVLTVVAAVALGRRSARQRAAREAARVRAILSVAGNPYEGGLSHEPDLRAEQAQEMVFALTGPQPRSVLLLGARGMGKTTLLRQLASGVANKLTDARMAAAYLDLAVVSDGDFFAQAIGGLYDALTPRMVGERPRLVVHSRASQQAAYGEREFASDASRLFASVQPAPDALNVALLLDNAGALDGFPGATRDAVRRLVLASVGPYARLRLALAAEDTPACLQGLNDALAVVQLPPLPAPELERLLLASAKGAYEWDADATRGAVALSQGRPGRLREIAEKAVANARRGGRIRIARTDVSPVRSAP